MRGGEAFSERQRRDIVRAIQLAQAKSGLRFSVYVGAVTGDLREYARRLHAALGADASRAVLVLVDPGSRGLEIVTGTESRSQVPDRSSALAAMTMTAAFAVGDLHGGICQGLAVLAEQARRHS